MALLPQHFIDCVVTIGYPDSKGSTDWVATGFFYGKFIEELDENLKNYRVFLITNRHVFEDRSIAKVRFNPDAESPAGEYDLYLISKEGDKLWYSHEDPKVDIAIIPVNAGEFQKIGIDLRFFQDDTQVAPLEKCKELGLSEGDNVYALGFPMGLIGGQRNYVVVRQGIVARIRDTFAGYVNDFLIDTFIFPGNSGGPAVTRPELTAIHGTKPIGIANLIGVIVGYVPYQDIAVSVQTNRPRVVFEENSGLAAVHPVDFVLDVIMDAISIMDQREEAMPQELPSTASTNE